MLGTEDFKNFNPKNNNPNPIKISPIFFLFVTLEKIRGRPIPTAGRAILLILNLNPKTAINHPVKVVPIFAPIMTPIDSVKVSKPAFTKLTTITVVADEDWTRHVVRNPVNTPATLFCVIYERISLSRLPATFWMPSLIIFIPNRKTPREPRILRTVDIPDRYIKY